MDSSFGFQSTPSSSKGKHQPILDFFEPSTIADPQRDPDALPRHSYNLRARTKPQTAANALAARRGKQGAVRKRKLAGRLEASRRPEVSVKNLQSTAPGRLRYLLRSRIKNGEQLELSRLADNTRPRPPRKVTESRPNRLGTTSLQVDGDGENTCETTMPTDQEMVLERSMTNPCNEQTTQRATTSSNKDGACTRTEHNKSYLDGLGERRLGHGHQTLPTSCTAEKTLSRDVTKASWHPETVATEELTATTEVLGTGVNAQNRVQQSGAVPDNDDQGDENVEYGRIHSKEDVPRRTSPSATALYEDTSYRSGQGSSCITSFTTQPVPSRASPRRARLENCSNENIDLDVVRETAAHRPSPREAYPSRKHARDPSDDEQVVPPKPSKSARKDDTDLRNASKTPSQLKTAKPTVRFPGKRPKNRVQRPRTSNVVEGKDYPPATEPETQMSVTAADSSRVRSDSIGTDTMEIEPHGGGPSTSQVTEPLLGTQASQKKDVSPHGADRSSNCSTQNGGLVAPKSDVDRRSREEQGSHKFTNIEMPQTAQEPEAGCFSATTSVRNGPDYDLPQEPGVADTRCCDIAAPRRDRPTKGDHQPRANDVQDRGGQRASTLPKSNTPSSSRGVLPAVSDDTVLPELVLPPDVRVPLGDVANAHHTVRLKASQEFDGKEADQIESSNILRGTSNLRAGAAPTQFFLSSPFLGRRAKIATKDGAETAEVCHQTSNCHWLFSEEYQPDLVIPNHFKPPDDTDGDQSCPTNNHKANEDELKHTLETTTSSSSHDEKIAARKPKSYTESDHDHDKQVRIALDLWTKLAPANCWAQFKQQFGWTSRALDELMLMPGIEEVKSEFLDILVRAYRQDASPSTSLDERHAIFLGNPGTGMATVAQIYAMFLEEQGQLCRPYHVRIVSASTLHHVGAEGLKRDLDRNESRHVILVEDAHQLATHETATVMPILGTLCSEMRGPESRVVWIFAGRQAPLLAMLDSYPNMRDVFGSWFYFADLSEQHVQALLLRRIREQSTQGMQLEGGDNGPIVQHVARLICQDRGQAGFGNGEVVESVVSQILSIQKYRLERERVALSGNLVRSTPELTLLTSEDMLGWNVPPHQDTFNTDLSTTERKDYVAGRTLQLREQSTAKIPNGAGELGHIIKVTSAPSCPDIACSPLTSTIRRSTELASANGGFYDVADEPLLGKQYTAARVEKYVAISHMSTKSIPNKRDVHIMSSPVLEVSADVQQALGPTNKGQDTAKASTGSTEIIIADVTSASIAGQANVQTGNLQQQESQQPSLLQHKLTNDVAGLVFDKYDSPVRPVIMQLAEARSPDSGYALSLREPFTPKFPPPEICNMDAISSSTQTKSVAAVVLETSRAPRPKAEPKSPALFKTARSNAASETEASLANNVVDESPAATIMDQSPDDGTILPQSQSQSQSQSNLITAHLDAECFSSATATKLSPADDGSNAPLTRRFPAAQITSPLATSSPRSPKPVPVVTQPDAITTSSQPAATIDLNDTRMDDSKRDCVDKLEPIIVGRTFHGWMKVSATTADRGRRLIEARRVPNGRHCDYFYVPSVRDSRSHARRAEVRNGFRSLEWVAKNLESHGSCRRTAIWVTAFRACMGKARAKKELAAWQPQQPCLWGPLQKRNISESVL